MKFTPVERETLAKFFKDPDWKIVQKAIGEKIIALEGLSMVDETKPAEDVKAQVIGNKVARNILRSFFQACDIIQAEDFSETAKDDENFN